ncbi:sensor histidine kinase [Amphibacillus sediminis]|uniref:sensor histidine kinase n=1 Tax=Amphibacillus sediminis TaxID=360185 RepID=UPI00082A5A1F|nr:sensor histidine kinase [Amphibacillus sediminis]
MKKAFFSIFLRNFCIIMLFSIGFLVILFTQVSSLSWPVLLSTSFGRFPLGLILIFVIIVASLLTSLIPYLIYKKEFKIIHQLLEQVEAGNDERVRYYGKVSETQMITYLISRIQTNLHAQTMRIQKVMSERIEDQEEQIEARITEERNRLARELHDSVSQELFAASMLVSAINEMSETNSDQLKRPLEQVESMIQQAQLEMRALLLHLRPIALKDHALKEGIDQLLTELVAKIPIHVNWRTEQITLNRAVEDHLFRILQESLSNALRHAKASQVDVLFIERDGMVVLSVVDDGVGFDSEAQQSGSYGLVNMKERAEEIGAQYRLVSVPNQGTKVEVRVLINKEGDESQ